MTDMTRLGRRVVPRRSRSERGPGGPVGQRRPRSGAVGRRPSGRPGADERVRDGSKKKAHLEAPLKC